MQRDHDLRHYGVKGMEWGKRKSNVMSPEEQLALAKQFDTLIRKELKDDVHPDIVRELVDTPDWDTFRRGYVEARGDKEKFDKSKSAADAAERLRKAYDRRVAIKKLSQKSAQRVPGGRQNLY